MSDLQASTSKEGDSEVTITYQTKSTLVLIAIDTHKSMFEKENMAFKMVLKGCLEVLEPLLFNTRHRKHAIVFLHNTPELVDFCSDKETITDKIKKIKEVLAYTDEKLIEKYQRNGDEDFDFAEFLQKCKKDYCSQYDIKKFLLLTNNDNPVGDDINKRFTTKNQFKLFPASDIRFQLIALRKDFNYNVFYNEVFFILDIKEEEVCVDTEGVVFKLNSVLIMSASKFKLNFYINKNDLSQYLMVEQRGLVRRDKMFNNAKLTLDGKTVERKTTYAVESCGTNTVRRLYRRVTADPVAINTTDLEANAPHKDLPLGYHLQYVSKRNTPEEISTVPPKFLFFNKFEDKGSSDIFNNFWKYCKINDVVLVCIKKTNRTGALKYVELIPHKIADECAFMSKAIPTCTNIFVPKRFRPGDKRQLPLASVESDIRRAKRKLVRKFVNELTFDYIPCDYPNPKLVKKRAYIKAKLMDEAIDLTQIKDETAEPYTSQELTQIKEAIYEMFHLDEMSSKKKKPKRRAPASSSGSSSKRTKS